MSHSPEKPREPRILKLAIEEMSSTRPSFKKGNGTTDKLQDELRANAISAYDDDNEINAKEDCPFPWCNALASLSLFCPIPPLHSKIKNSNSKEKNYLGTPLIETPIEYKRKRRLLEGLLEAEESIHNFDIFTHHSHLEEEVG